jgi:hypothetical protein
MNLLEPDPYRLSPLSACTWAPRVSFTRLPARCSTAATKAALATMTLRQTARIVFGFLTTEPNAEVEPIHPKAMPVILTTSDEIETWMTAPTLSASWPASAQRTASGARVRESWGLARSRASGPNLLQLH